jgi:hypothetical protein
MAQFRPKKLDLGCFVNIMNIRDHTKRKVFEQHEPERYASFTSRALRRLCQSETSANKH